jgi:EAL domain-containing protein (putative c-di-GMP-specific phosphodiesterase class I)
MRRVLVLDDDPCALLLLSRHLQSRGLEVIACREPEAAEAVMDLYSVEAIVTDLCVSPLGGLGGVRMIQNFSTHFPETRIVAVSAYVTDEIADLCRKVGAGAVLQKPVDLEELSRRVTGDPAPSREGGGLVHDVPDLDRYLAGNSIYSVLQPIVSLRKGGPPFETLGAECLCRSSGLSLFRNPEFLFTYASRKDRLYETDLLSIRAALDQGARLAPSRKLFINIHPRSLTNPRLTGELRRLIREAGIPASSVAIELTERQTILNPRAFAATVADLRESGFRIALDDYGEGFANLQWLIDLKPDYLKLSGFLSMNLRGDRTRQAIVASTAHLARDLEIPTILEWVENAEQAGMARDLGIDYGQGYLFARPAPAEDLVRSNRFAGLFAPSRPEGAAVST